MKSRMKPGPVIFVALYLAAQLTFAVRGTLRPYEKTRFSWRMFLESARFARFEIGFRDGRVLDLNALEPKVWIPVIGSYVDLPRFAPSYLCGKLPDAAWVRVHVSTVAPAEHRCP